ncbi:MAG: DNA double-strand break repair nuclease NurA [Deltaproteobacteria bacterium]|nr:DNA double-strand break repair nuclease NurA [Deltaproteobacteria bacterium]
MTGDQTPFADLPAALVEEVLSQSEAVAEGLLADFQKFRKDRETLRKRFLQSGIVTSESTLGYPPLPTTCAADGSYAIERLLTTDLAAAAAVAVEGLTPPSEKRHWEQPHHRTFLAAEPHLEDTATVLRTLMLGEELCLATTAPHDLVMLDGTLTLPVIYFNQGLNKAPETSRLRCSIELIDRSLRYLEAYRAIVRSERSDKQYAALPKYSTRREIGKEVGWPEGFDDRGMLTLLLDPGELTKPRLLEQPGQQWHINAARLPEAVRAEIEALAGDAIDALCRVHVFYYKPHDWLPALRVEVAESIARNTHRLATVVQGLKHQCATASMLEPYPIYLADRTVKALARALPAFRQVTTQRISEKYTGNIGEVFFAMHGYRSDSGR